MDVKVNMEIIMTWKVVQQTAKTCDIWKYNVNQTFSCEENNVIVCFKIIPFMLHAKAIVLYLFKQQY